MAAQRLCDGRWRIIRLKNIEAFEFLVQHGKRLELLRLVHLHFEPIFDFILLYFLEVGMGVVQMSMESCENWINVQDSRFYTDSAAKGSSVPKLAYLEAIP